MRLGHDSGSGVGEASDRGVADRPVPADDLAPRLRLAVTRTARRLRQESGSLLSPSLTAALATIERHGPMTPSDLAARERIQRPTATRLLARLEEERLVTRTPDPADGRSSLVSPTPAGRALLEGVRTRKTAYLARRLEELDAGDRAALARAADVLERMFDAEPDAGGTPRAISTGRTPGVRSAGRTPRGGPPS
jgi:DNA-binding MarR family transcriptional regulator